jgi:hypothetical protein
VVRLRLDLETGEQLRQALARQAQLLGRPRWPAPGARERLTDEPALELPPPLFE